MDSLNSVPLLWRLLVTLAVISGAREGEIVALEWKHIDFDNNTIKIEQSLTLKTGEGVKVKSTKTNRVRIVSIPTSLMKLLKDWQTENKVEKLSAGVKLNNSWDDVDRNFIFTAPNSFGHPLRPDSVSQWWNRFLKKNSNLKKITFHGL
jgi:integrase